MFNVGILEGLMLHQNGMQSNRKLRRLHVLGFVCRKLSVNLLTQPLFGILLPGALINLFPFPLWAFLVVSLSCGIAQFF